MTQTSHRRGDTNDLYSYEKISSLAMLEMQILIGMREILYRWINIQSEFSSGEHDILIY